MRRTSKDKSRGRKASASTVDSRSSSSSSSSYDETYSTKMPKKRSTAANKRRSTGAKVSSTGHRRQNGSRGGRVTSKGRTLSRNKSRYFSSSESVDYRDESFSSSSSDSQVQVRQLSRPPKTTGTSKRRQTKKKSSAKKKSNSKGQKRSKVGKTSRRRRRRTLGGSSFRKTKAKRRGVRSKKQKKAPLVSGQRLLSSMSSKQASLKTNASQVNSKDDSGVVLSLPISPAQPKSVDKVASYLHTADVLKDVKESVVPIGVDFQGELVLQKVELKGQFEEQTKSFSSLMTFDSSADSASPYSGTFSPLSSFQVTVNSPSLVDSVNQASFIKQQAPVAVIETVTDLLHRVETDDEDEDQESDGLDVLLFSRLESLKNFVKKVEANLCKEGNNTSVNSDDVSSKKSDSSNESLSSVEKLQQMLDRCYDCRSSSSEMDSQKEVNIEMATSNEMDQMLATLKEKDENEPKADINNFVDNRNSGSSLSFSVKSAD